MALAKTFAAALTGITGHVVTVEANIGPGLPGIHMVGLGDAAVRESRERIRTAVANSELPWPKTKIVVSLSPAGLPKRGSHFDLAIALAVLAARNEQAAARLQRVLVLGELGLDGQIKPVPGVLPSLLAGQRAGFDTAIIPAGNASEVALIDDIAVFTAATLIDAWHFASAGTALPLASASPSVPTPTDLDFADIAGQPRAKLAAEVAAAGGHHMFMVGPPGSGKSMIAERIPTILPELSRSAALDVAAVRSVAATGLDDDTTSAPFIAPHHTITRAGLVGGGQGTAAPGAISMAHHGVLFLDEVSEIPARVLDGLRIPLEHGRIRLQRNHEVTTFPAEFQLVLAANPCRCGAEEAAACTCSVAERAKHLRNVSGPLLDRIDIHVETTSRGASVSLSDAEPSSSIAQRVAQARDRARYRWREACLPYDLNARVPSTYLRRQAPADDAGMALLEAHLAGGAVTQRGVDKALKLAWTLCDLDGAHQPDLDHIARALDLRTPLTQTARVA